MRFQRWLVSKPDLANLLLPFPGVLAVMGVAAYHEAWWAVALAAAQEAVLVSALRAAWDDAGEGEDG